jgi:hypothetical protein
MRVFPSFILRAGLQREVDYDRTMVRDVERVSGGIYLMTQQFHATVGKHVVKRVGERIALLRERAAENAVRAL